MTVGKTMPKQLRSNKKGEKKPSQTIKIAKANMTLTGFEHTKATMKKKDKQIKKGAIYAKIPGQIDVISKGGRSKSSRAMTKSSMKRST